MAQNDLCIIETRIYSKFYSKCLPGIKPRLRLVHGPLLDHSMGSPPLCDCENSWQSAPRIEAQSLLYSISQFVTFHRA